MKKKRGRPRCAAPCVNMRLHRHSHALLRRLADRERKSVVDVLDLIIIEAAARRRMPLEYPLADSLAAECQAILPRFPDSETI